VGILRLFDALIRRKLPVGLDTPDAEVLTTLSSKCLHTTEFEQIGDFN